MVFYLAKLVKVTTRRRFKAAGSLGKGNLLHIYETISGVFLG